MTARDESLLDPLLIAPINDAFLSRIGDQSPEVSSLRLNSALFNLAIGVQRRD